MFVVVGMYERLPPNAVQFLQREAIKLAKGYVDELDAAFRVGGPNDDRRAIGHRAKPCFAVAQPRLVSAAIRHVDLGAHRADGMAVRSFADE